MVIMGRNTLIRSRLCYIKAYGIFSGNLYYPYSNGRIDPSCLYLFKKFFTSFGHSYNILFNIDIAG
jgi:hypothetical protein